MKCETCGNDYDKVFVVAMDGKVHTFDSFECAIERLAPRCEHCQVRILGHGVEVDDRLYCCAHCAHASGSRQAVDRI